MSFIDECQFQLQPSCAAWRPSNAFLKGKSNKCAIERVACSTTWFPTLIAHARLHFGTHGGSMGAQIGGKCNWESLHLPLGNILIKFQGKTGPKYK